MTSTKNVFLPSEPFFCERNAWALVWSYEFTTTVITQHNTYVWHKDSVFWLCVYKQIEQRRHKNYVTQPESGAWYEYQHLRNPRLSTKTAITSLWLVDWTTGCNDPSRCVWSMGTSKLPHIIRCLSGKRSVPSFPYDLLPLHSPAIIRGHPNTAILAYRHAMLRLYQIKAKYPLFTM
jgi:hypothetical protein